MSTFPLDQWFDITKQIDKDDRETAEAQMMLYAIKDGTDLDSPDVRSAIADLRTAVKRHNAEINVKTHRK